MTNCPLCSSAAPEGAAECPSCGVIFAKLRARAEREKSAAAKAPETTAARNPWRVRIAALSVVACWMLCLGIYYHIELSRRPRHVKPIALEGRSSVTMRDAYDLIGEVPVHTARSGPARREQPPSPPPEPEDSQPDPFDE